MMMNVLYTTIYVCAILFLCSCDHVSCNSNNTNTKNFQNLRLHIETQVNDEEGHYMKYDDLYIHHDKNARSLMLKIKALYEIGERSPNELINILNNDDPLGVSRLTNPHEFVCNKSERFPYRVDHDKIKRFKDHEEGYYIFFQHIRKAGGTTMCALAQENLQSNETSSDYCFLDPWTGSLGSYPYNDEEYFQNQVRRRGYRYVPNEASPFDDAFFSYHGAIFITMFREPMDRWYSQYRFDYLEGRYLTKTEREEFESPSGHKLTFVEWYRAHKSWFTCPNVYTNAFIGQTLVDTNLIQKLSIRSHGPREPITFFWAYQERAKISMTHKNFIRALDNLLKFSMVFILEWLNDEASSQVMFKEFLGWTKTAEHVLPQQNVVKRDDNNQTHHHTLAEDVNHDDYMEVARDNLFDLLLYQIAKRIFLERLSCHDAR